MTSAARNLRHSPRLDVAMTAEIVVPGEIPVQTEVANLSRLGLMLHCDQPTLQKLLPNTRPVQPIRPVRFATRFRLPVVGTESVWLDAECEVIHTRRQSRERFELGLRFVQMSEDASRYLGQYINYRLHSA